MEQPAKLVDGYPSITHRAAHHSHKRPAQPSKLLQIRGKGQATRCGNYQSESGCVTQASPLCNKRSAAPFKTSGTYNCQLQ